MIFIVIIMFLSMACSAAESAAATERALSANSNASVESTTTSQETVLQWVQITVVPVGVFLMGACIWSIIKNTAAWEHSLNACGRRAPRADPLVPAENHLISDGRIAQALEEGGLELPHRRLATTPDSPPDARDGMRPEVEVPNDEEIPRVGTAVQPQLV